MGKLRTLPGKNLNATKNNILYTIRTDAKLAAVDLTSYEIYAENDFYIISV